MPWQEHSGHLGKAHPEQYALPDRQTSETGGITRNRAKNGNSRAFRPETVPSWPHGRIRQPCDLQHSGESGYQSLKPLS